MYLQTRLRQPALDFTDGQDPQVDFQDGLRTGNGDQALEVAHVTLVRALKEHASPAQDLLGSAAHVERLIHHIVLGDSDGRVPEAVVSCTAHALERMRDDQATGLKRDKHATNRRLDGLHFRYW